MFGLFGKPSKRKFAELVIRKIREQGAPADFTFHEDEFEIRRGTARGFLANVYDSYCRTKGTERERHLANFVSAFTATWDNDPEFADVESDLVTVVRERALFESSSLLWSLDSREVKVQQEFEPISNWYVKTLVIDAPTHMSIVNASQVKKWGQTTDELYAIGLSRLKASRGAEFVEHHGVFRSQWKDDYDASRVLVPGILDDLPLRGDPVVVLPNRVTMLVADSENAEAVRRMLATAEDLVGNAVRPHNPAPLIVRNGRIEDFRVGKDSELYSCVERSRGIASLAYYNEQKSVLDEMYKKHEKDLFVASFQLTKDTMDAYTARATWTKDVPTLLPLVDEVVFVDLDRGEGKTVIGSAKWESVLEVLGESLLDVQMFPKRFYVSTFPTAEQLERLFSS